MLRLIRVRGHSMVPAYRDGDYVLVASRGLLPLRAGHDVVCRTAEGVVLKRIEERCGRRLGLSGLNSLSISRQQLGDVSCDDVIGRVILRVPRKGRASCHGDTA